MAHRLTRNADADLEAIVVHLAEQGASVAIAEKLVSELVDRLNLLADFPRMGRDRSEEWGEGRRRSFVAGNYVIVYRIDKADVVILRVVHGRQDIDAILRS